MTYYIRYISNGYSAMATNFKLTAAARTLSLKDVYSMGEDKAYGLFRQLRWPDTEGKAVCPRCGHGQAYEITTRRKFKCKACSHQFSVTSGTIFASRKLAFTDMLAAIAILANAAKGLSAMQLSRDIDVQHKTAWILAHKLREAMAAETADHKLAGVVEVDGSWYGGHIRPENRAEDRIDRRLKEHQDRQAPLGRGRAPAQGPHAAVSARARGGRRRNGCQGDCQGRDGSCRRSEPLGRVARAVPDAADQPL